MFFESMKDKTKVIDATKEYGLASWIGRGTHEREGGEEHHHSGSPSCHEDGRVSCS